MPTKLGQHFLIDESIADRIIKYADPKGKLVLEIGSGKGILTKKLINLAKKLYVIEIDKRFCDLAKKIGAEVIHGDAVKVEFPHVDMVISNLPYQISSPITEKILRKNLPAILMYQKEFAMRITADPGDPEYSSISFLVRYLSKPEILETVPRNAFKPMPKVDAAIVKLSPKNIKPDEYLLKFARMMFQHRKNVVGKAIISSSHLSRVDKKTLRDLVRKRLKSKKRVYELDINPMKEIAYKFRDVFDNKA
ncbi:ribosomal RNA small subunit methyltransferase A [Nanoarchaeota archaeon]|nr:MAG: ribosomal RNA small subunit methyltransferase A [Nanoarchaeota archaeon]